MALAPKTATAPQVAAGLPDRQVAERFLIQTALNSMLAEVTAQRARETQTISRHLDISLNELINRQQLRLAELLEMQQRGDPSQPLAANDYWLYVVFHCATPSPSLNILRDPSTLDWQAVTRIEHYRLRQDPLKHPVELPEEPPDYRTS